MVKILVLDNYDSFVYTLNGYLRQLGAETEVVRNDAIEESELPELLAKFDAVLISPGPGTPASAGLSIPTVKLALESNYPVFGVCLGHQAIAEAMGATVQSAPELMHGKTSQVNHEGSPIFEGLPQGFTATRRPGRQPLSQLGKPTQPPLALLRQLQPAPVQVIVGQVRFAHRRLQVAPSSHVTVGGVLLLSA